MRPLTAIIGLLTFIFSLAHAAEPVEVLGLPLGAELNMPIGQCAAAKGRAGRRQLCWASVPQVEQGARGGTIDLGARDRLPKWAVHANVRARVEKDGTLSRLAVETLAPVGYRNIKEAISAEFGSTSREDPLSSPHPAASWDAKHVRIELECAARCKVEFVARAAVSSPVAAAGRQAAANDFYGTRWRLRIMDLQHGLKVDAVIRFAKDAASESCMGGTWNRVVVESDTAHDKAYFPLAEPLAFTLEHGMLVFGRTAVCDGYLFLSALPAPSTMRGTYAHVALAAVTSWVTFRWKGFASGKSPLYRTGLW
jgi:hypothetical protein